MDYATRSIRSGSPEELSLTRTPCAALYVRQPSILELHWSDVYASSDMEQRRKAQRPCSVERYRAFT